MRAAVFVGPNEWRVEQRPEPKPGPGQIVIAVRAAGVCGTDLHIFRGRFPATFPRVPGHEFAGEVLAVGAGVRNVRVGDRVSADPVIPCNACDYCRRSKPHLCRDLQALGIQWDGGFATHCVMPAEQAVPVPQGVGFDAAALAEPIACCLHGLDLAGIALGDRVAIIGAGWIGLIMLQLARLRGAGFVSISEKIAAKRELAERLAADRVVDPQAEDYAAVVREATGGGADVVIECVGSAPTAAQALTLVRDGGTVLLFGVAPQEAEIAVRPFEIYRRELRLIGSFSTPRKHAAAIALLAGGRLEIEPLITGRFGLEGAGEAMEALESGKAIKSLIVNDE